MANKEKTTNTMKRTLSRLEKKLKHIRIEIQSQMVMVDIDIFIIYIYIIINQRNGLFCYFCS